MTFAQVTNEQGLIDDFRPIESGKYYAELNVPMGLTRRVGEASLFAVRLSDGSLSHGDYQTLRQQLASIDLHTLGAPFFNIDAYSFIGNREKKALAAELAGHLFADQRITQEWRKLETASTAIGLTPARVNEKYAAAELTRTPPEFAFLTDYFDDEMWTLRWAKLWKARQDRAFLKDIALQWLETPSATEKASGVILILLSDHPVDTQCIGAALHWLNGAHWPAPWSQVWDRLHQLSETTFQDLSQTLTNSTLYYLQHGHQGIAPGKWPMAWSKLYRQGYNRSLLVDLALDRLPVFETYISFQRRVLTPLFRDLSDARHFKDEVILPWLERVEVSNTWIATFIDYASEAPKSVIEKAKRFIQRGDAPHAQWHLLWRSLHQFEDPALLDSAALRWLSLTDQSLKAWPQVLLDMLKRRPTDPELKKLAKAWLSNTPAGTMSFLISNRVNENHFKPYSEL